MQIKRDAVKLVNGKLKLPVPVMRILKHTLITLPLLAASAMPLRPASAEPVTPLMAIELLSRSAAIDSKCKHLDAAEAQELLDYAAKAEIAAATQTSVEETQAARAAGRGQGQAALCGTESMADVRATLAAAREAMAAVSDEEPATAPVVAAKPAKKAVPTKIADTKREKPPVKQRKTEEKVAAAPKLQGGYASAAMAYYVDRRCRHLSLKEAKRFYAGILRGHQAAVAANGKQVVAALLRSAESKANAVSCGSRSASLVKSGYARSVN